MGASRKMTFEPEISVTPYIYKKLSRISPLKGVDISVTGNYETFRDMSRIPGASA